MVSHTSYSEETTRAAARYQFAVPVTVELSNGLLRTPDHIAGLLVDLSHGGAGVVVPSDNRLRQRKRYRVIVDDYNGIIEIRNISQIGDGQLRLGVSFKSLGLELQELVSDVLERAQQQSSRLRQAPVPESISSVHVATTPVEGERFHPPLPRI